MVTEFSKKLSMLRQEKGSSQRSVAAALGVSQALLSHYENGAREPGFDFLIRAAEYYGVSTDYLLGRTTFRRLTILAESDIVFPGDDTGNSALTHFRVKILTNSISALFSLLEKNNQSALIETVSRYLETAMYRVLRYLATPFSLNEGSLFMIPQDSFAEHCDIEMKHLELDLKRKMPAFAAGCPACSKLGLSETYPNFVTPLLALMQFSDETLSKREL